MDNTAVIPILRVGIHGEGVGTVEGYTVFVEGALPGEVVRVRFVERRKSYGRAVVIEWLEKSRERVEPICPVFGRCGGCQLMHLQYEAQLRVKRQRVIDALERIGKLQVEVDRCVAAPMPLHYRNKIQLPVQNGKLGLYGFNSHDLVEIEECFIHTPLGERVMQVLKRYAYREIRYVVIKTAVKTQEVLVVVVTSCEIDLKELARGVMEEVREVKGVVQNVNPGEGNRVLGDQMTVVAGEGAIEDEICGLRFKVSPASFFQVNPFQAEQLYGKVVELAGLKGHERVLDGYCGVGTLSLLLAQQCGGVVGIESVPEAIDDARFNAERNGVTNVSFICGRAEEVDLGEFDVAVINPPRKGCEPEFIKKLLESEAERLIYVSCDPATLARDLGVLKEKYLIESVTPFDMFPQTAHVETAVLLRLNR